VPFRCPDADGGKICYTFSTDTRLRRGWIMTIRPLKKWVLCFILTLAMALLAAPGGALAQDGWQKKVDGDYWYLERYFLIPGSGEYSLQYDIEQLFILIHGTMAHSKPLEAAVITVDNHYRFELSKCMDGMCWIDEPDLHAYRQANEELWQALYEGRRATVQVNDGTGWYSHVIELQDFRRVADAEGLG